MKKLAKIKLRKGMSKEEVNSLLKEYNIEFNDTNFENMKHPHNWTCKCGNPIKNRRWDTVRGDNKKPPRLKCDICVSKDKREEVIKGHKERVNSLDGYIYIRSYFENDIIWNDKNNIRVLKDRKAYIEAKHLLCGSIIQKQVSSFTNEKIDKICSTCNIEYEKSFKYYVEEVLNGKIEDFWSYEYNTINPKYITAKGSTTEYYFKCTANLKHNVYLSTTEKFIRSYENTKVCPECKKDYGKENGSNVGKSSTKHKEEDINKKLNESKINNNLKLIKIDRAPKATYFELLCDRHNGNEDLIKINSTNFNNKVNSELICKKCKFELERNNAYDEFIIKYGLFPININEWSNKSSYIICKDNRKMLVKCSLKSLEKGIKPMRLEKNYVHSYHNLKILVKEAGFIELLEDEYKDASTRYYGKYKDGLVYSFTIYDLEKIIENKYNHLIKLDSKSKYLEYNLTQILKLYNYEPIAGSINKKEKSINAITEEGYKVKVNVYDLMSGKRPLEFSSRSKFYYENYQLLCDKLGLNIKINKKLTKKAHKEENRDKDYCYGVNSEGYILKIRHLDIKRRREESKLKFFKGHHYAIDNIKLYCKKERPDYTILKDQKYESAKSKLKFKYLGKDIKDLNNEDERIFEMSWDNFRKGEEHPKLSDSAGNRKISEFAHKNNILFDSEVRFTDCKNINPLPFDRVFYYKGKEKGDIACIVEYHGRQHFENIEYFGGLKEFLKRKRNDRIKAKWCKDNGIELIVLSCSVDKIEETLSMYLKHKNINIMK